MPGPWWPSWMRMTRIIRPVWLRPSACPLGRCSPRGCASPKPCTLGSVGGYRYQAALWGLRATGRLELHDLTSAEADRMAALMAQYQDTPMDLADASLVVVAESRTLRRVFTTDSDFYVYRLADGSALEAVP